MKTGRDKVFCVGFHKTGTKSLGAALECLGYHTCGPRWTKDEDITTKVREAALALVPRYDAFQDNPWPLLYADLDAHFPGSRFILTVDDPAVWTARVCRYFGTRDTPMRRWIYGEDAGSPIGNETLYRARFEAHNRAVQAHFATRPGQLLVWPMIAEPGWERLCTFLDCPVPDDRAFPHKNRARDAKSLESIGKG